MTKKPSPKTKKDIHGQGDSADGSGHGPGSQDVLLCFPETVRSQAKRAALVVRANWPRRGVNVLVHGPAGVGKEFFAETMAGLLKAEFSRRSFDASGLSGEASEEAKAQLTTIRDCEAQSAGKKQVLAISGTESLYDLCGRDAFSGILSNPGCIRFWLAEKRPNGLPCDVARLFDAAVGIPQLEEADRLRIWRHHLGRLGIGKGVGKKKIAELAKSYPVDAGAIARAAETLAEIARSSGKPVSRTALPAVEAMLASQCELRGMEEDPKPPAKKPMDLDALKAFDIRSTPRAEDVVRSFERHVAGEDTAEEAPFGPDIMSLLLYGPPGSGKTRFANALAGHLGLPIRRVSAGDVLESYVGATERNLKAVFRDAAENGEMLFFDEADGLLRSRAKAEQPWLVTQVNELLVCMDAHPGIMVFATNLVHNLDPAVLRRFTFKMEFGYLTREGRRQFFQKAFRTPLTPADAMRLDGMDRLTPGDFRTVSQGLRLAGDHADNKTRLDALAQEIARKPATEAWRLTAQSRSVIGFR